jgi:hypothetical protein
MSIIELELLNFFKKNPEKTCFVLKEEQVIFSSEFKGVKPLKDFYEQFGHSDIPLVVVDKIMGKGAVVLADLIGAKIIVTPVISEIALAYANSHDIKATYVDTVPYIINRTGDGRCPIESAVLTIDDTKIGYDVIKKTLKSLFSNNYF